MLAIGPYALLVAALYSFSVVGFYIADDSALDVPCWRRGNTFVSDMIQARETGATAHPDAGILQLVPSNLRETAGG